MDLVSSCKDKLTFFRIKELKDVLTQMGLAKQGKKQDLLDRILAVISDDQGAKLNGWAKKKALAKEAIAKIIDDTYRKMQVHGATDLASKGQNSSNSSGMQPKQEADKSFQPDMKIRCPCGSSLGTESMIECEDPRCHVWQHMACVIIPEKAMEGVSPEIPAQFYCEICRVNRADPFWVTLANPLYPVKLTPSSLTTEGGNPVQTVEKTFTLTKSDRDLLQKTECDLQAWCILLNDKVSFRMQWPQYADLHVNGVPVRTTNRPGTQLLGINGRDDGPAITCGREGINKISLSCCDARVFCFGVRIVRRRSVQQVLSLIPKVANGERFEEALTRVSRCIGGSNSANNADSDSDLEVVADSVTVNLRCPMSGSRMKTAGRFKPCVHMGCFDLDTFVELNQRSRKWQCPICLKNYSLEHIIIDPYFNRITSMMWDCGEDVNEIDVKPDGSWRVKNEIEHRDLARWHYPDGSLCVPVELEMRPNPELMKQIKQETGSDGHSPLKLGIKKNRNGIWEVSKREEMRPQSSGAKIDINAFQKIMHMSSSATGSYREDEDPSVNQDGGGNFEFSTNNGHELDSFSLNLDSTYGAPNRGLPAAQPVDLDVIVLSDSEEDNVHLISTETIYETGPAQNNGINFSVPPPSVADSYLGDPGHNTSGSPGLGLFNNQDDDFGMPLWSLPPCSQAGTSLQLFGTDTEVQETLGDERVTSAVQVNEFGLGTDKVLGTSSEVPDSFGCHSKAELTGGLVDNPLAFADDDPSLQIFLPSWPARGATRPDLRENTDISTADRTEDWISLSLGGGGGTHCGSDTAASCLNSQHQLRSEGRMESPANTASLLMSMNEDRSNKTQSNKRTSAGPFSHPRQPRSVRPRLYLSIESESE